MAKICMISVDHSPIDDRIFYKEAMTLSSNGHEVSMICKADDQGVCYDMGGKTALNNPDEKSFAIEGIECHAISFSSDRIQRLLFKLLKGQFVKEYLAKGIEIGADVYHAHEPVSFYLGYQITKKNGAKLIFDAHESWRSGTKKEMWIQRNYLSKLHYLITANQLTRGYLTNLNPNLKSEVIYNAAESRLYSSRVEKSDDAIVFTHEGYLPFNRGLKEMLKAFAWVHEKKPNTRFKIIGKVEGDEKEFLERFIEQNDLNSSVEITGWLPYEEVGKHLMQCDIGIIAKRPLINNVLGGPPIKYFNYLAAGLAVIDTGMPETERLIKELDNGIIATGSNTESLAAAMLKLAQNNNLLGKLKAKSLKGFQSFSWDESAKKLLNFYSMVLTHR
jgi:glycosyltransferase involved in cell wall biosynthesis